MAAGGPCLGVLDATPHARRARAAPSEGLLRHWIFRGLGLRLEAARPRPTKAAAATAFAAVELLGSIERLRLPTASWCTVFAPTRAACCPDVVTACLECLPAMLGVFVRSGTRLGGAFVGCAVCVHNRVAVAGMRRNLVPSEADPVYLSYNRPCLLVFRFPRHMMHIGPDVLDRPRILRRRTVGPT